MESPLLISADNHGVNLDLSQARRQMALQGTAPLLVRSNFDPLVRPLGRGAREMIGLVWSWTKNGSVSGERLQEWRGSQNTLTEAIYSLDTQSAKRPLWLTWPRREAADDKKSAAQVGVGLTMASAYARDSRR